MNTNRAPALLRQRLRKNEIFIAISGGHSSSQTFAFHPDIGPLGAAAHTGINPHLYPYQTLKTQFVDLLDKLAVNVKTSSREIYNRTTKIVLSCAGAASVADQALLRVCLAEVFGETTNRQYIIVDDTWAGLVAGALTLKGTCAIAGTGASVFVGLGKKPTGWQGKLDGWGSIIGDYGSGFQLAVDMFRKFVRFWNEHDETPPLFRKVCALVKSEPLCHHLPHLIGIENTQKWFDTITLIDFKKEWRIHFARLAAVATRSADSLKPNPMATELVNVAASELARTIETALKRWPEAKKSPLVFQGGMFEHSNLYRSLVSERIKGIMQGPVALARFRPILGASLLALQESGMIMGTEGQSFLNGCLKSMPSKSRALLIRGRAAGFAHPDYPAMF